MKKAIHARMIRILIAQMVHPHGAISKEILQMELKITTHEEKISVSVVSILSQCHGGDKRALLWVHTIYCVREKPPFI